MGCMMDAVIKQLLWQDSWRPFLWNLLSLTKPPGWKREEISHSEARCCYEIAGMCKSLASHILGFSSKPLVKWLVSGIPGIRPWNLLVFFFVTHFQSLLKSTEDLPKTSVKMRMKNKICHILAFPQVFPIMSHPLWSVHPGSPTGSLLLSG